MKVVIYKTNENTFAILIPTSEVLQIATIEQIAQKDVPADCPYWIVDSEDLPKNVPVEAIYIDENEFPPHGYGAKSNELPTEALEKYIRLKEEIDGKG